MSRSFGCAARTALAVVAAFAALGSGCAGSPSTPDGNRPPDDAPRPDAVVRDGIEYRGDVLVMESFPVQLAGRVTITNRTGQDRTLMFPNGCLVFLRAYRPGESAPVWDQAREVACTQAIVPVRLPPGASREVGSPTVSAADILDEGLPDGRYRITLYLRPGNAEVEVEGGTVELAISR